MTGAPMGADEHLAELHRSFRPVRGPRVAVAVGVAQGLVLGYVAVAMSSSGPEAAHWWDRLGVLLVATAIGATLWRFARLAAFPDDGGLVVRNLSADRRLAWPEIVHVRFGDGDPWVTLDLADGDTLAVMAVQRADGPRSRREAGRLATLVALHSRTDRND
ncbi:MAG TPA: PH domain-containing protein [Kineosporiaceae bacterium]